MTLYPLPRRSSARRGRPLVGLFVGTALVLAGCTTDQGADGTTSTVTETVTATPALPVVTTEWPTVANDLVNGSLTRDLEMPGEQVHLTVDYWVEIDMSTWRTGTPRTVFYSLHLLEDQVADPESAPEVLIAEVRATSTLNSLTPAVDGLVQAERIDVPAGSPGYLINRFYPYEGRFAIDGFGRQLTDTWFQLTGSTPQERDLQTAGVYGSAITFEFTVLVKNTGDEQYHRRMVTDTLTVPVTPLPEEETTTTGASEPGPDSDSATSESTEG